MRLGSYNLSTFKVLFAFILLSSLPACPCDSNDYITSPDADVTATDSAPPAVAVE